MNNKSANNLGNRMRSSLAFKLNIRMMGRLLSSFLSLNVFIILLSLFIIIWEAEDEANDILNKMRTVDVSVESISLLNEDYEIYTEIHQGGYELPYSIQRFLPFEIKNAKRDFIIPKSNSNIDILNKISYIKYIIDFPLEGLSYQIVYNMGNDIRLFAYVFLVILGFEMFLLIENIPKGVKIVKRSLRPLEELTEKAKIINAEVSSMGSKTYDKYIKDLAGAISSIDVNKLDRRISIDSSQNELKELASAINEMLNRINSSYQAQIRFVSDASHELRTPISVIQGYVNLLDRWGKEDPNVMQESINAIKHEAENMKELIEQLLFLARSDNETINLQMECFDSCDLVDEVVKEAQLIDKNHDFEVFLNRPIYVKADRQLLKQAIRIFVDNSIKFTPSGKKIVLKVERKIDKVHIIIQDSGIGIEPKDLPHIFDRFYRSDESRARNTGGSGLGLSIAKWIIDRHEGYIEVLSRVNIGTRFTIVLPSTDIKEMEIN